MAAREVIDIDMWDEDEPVVVTQQVQVKRESASPAPAAATAATAAAAAAPAAVAPVASNATAAAVASPAAAASSTGAAATPSSPAPVITPAVPADTNAVAANPASTSAAAPTVASSPAPPVDSRASPTFPLPASSSYPAAAATSTPRPAAAAAPAVAPVSASAMSASSSAPVAPALQSAFEQMYREVHQHAPAAGDGAAGGPAPPLTAAALLDTFTRFMAHHQSLHQQLEAADLIQAQLQARVSASQRELLSFQPFLQSHVVASHAQKHAHLRACFMDPAVDALLSSAHAQRLNLQSHLNDLTERSMADSFVKDSSTGRKLLARTKRLVDENTHFGDQLSHAHPGLASAHATISALQLELTTQRTINKELNDTVTETLDWMHELETGCEAAVKVAQRQGNDAQRTSANDANAPAQHMQTGL